MTKRSIHLVLFLAFCGAQLRAADIWVLRNRESVPLNGSCNTLQSHGELLFQNVGSTDAVVKLLGISNGGNAAAAPDLVVPATRTVTVDTFATPIWSAGSNWWAVHLDVPAGVLTEARQNLGTVIQNCPPVPQPPTFTPNRGRVPMPVFHALVAANVPQRHLGSDAGSREATVTAVVFNAATVSASAHVQLFRACDDTVIAERTISLAANTTDSVSLPLVIACATPNRSVTASGFAYYTVVTVDQASLSVVVTTANVATPANDVSVADVEQPSASTRARAVRRQ